MEENVEKKAGDAQMKKVLFLAVVGVMTLTLVFGGAAFAGGPESGGSVKYTQTTIAEGDITIRECYADPTSNGAWKCVEVEGPSGFVYLYEDVVMSSDGDDGEIETNEFIAIAQVGSPMSATITVHKCGCPKGIGNCSVGDGTNFPTTLQMSAFKVDTNDTGTLQVPAPVGGGTTVSCGAFLEYHMEAWESDRSRDNEITNPASGLPCMECIQSTFKETYTMQNADGTTKRLLDMSGNLSNSYVSVEQKVIGSYFGSGTFNEYDVSGPGGGGLPPWWNI